MYLTLSFFFVIFVNVFLVTSAHENRNQTNQNHSNRTDGRQNKRREKKKMTSSERHFKQFGGIN